MCKRRKNFLQKSKSKKYYSAAVLGSKSISIQQFTILVMDVKYSGKHFKVQFNKVYVILQELL